MDLTYHLPSNFLMIVKMKKRIYSLLTFTALVGLLSACGDSFLDINTNPNQAVSSTPELTLTNALNVTAARLNPNEIGAFWSGQWSPSGSVSGFTAEKTYDIQTSFRTGIWTGPYDNLADYKYVETEARKVGKNAIAGMARVMKAYNYQQIVDAYNNAPYSDALKGTASIRPVYDDASVIYDSLIVDLNKAIAYLSEPISTTNTNPGAADIFFAGSNAKWIKFANTLKLRILIRESGVKAAYVTAQLASMPKTSASYLSADDNVTSNPGYIKSAGKMNQWYENYGFTSADAVAGNHDFYAWTDFFFTQVPQSDPRRTRLAYPVGGSGTSYVGVPFGVGNDTYLYSKISGFGPAFLPVSATAAASSDLYKRSQVIMTAAESFFLQSEAVSKGLITGFDKTGKELYESGITESFKFLAVPSAATAAATYINDHPYPAAAADQFKAIITQKWIALAGFNGFEAWTEYRRTGIPNVPLSTRAIGSVSPKRLLYPLSEYSNNAENVGAQGTINQFTSKIFWMN